MLEYDLDQGGRYLKENVRKSINANVKSTYKGGSTESIKNEMTTAPPLFLRSGYMIFSNDPKMRSKLL